jgi:hypothetical protein
MPDRLTAKQTRAMKALQDVMNSGIPTDDILGLCCTAILHICRSAPQFGTSPDQVLEAVIAHVKAGYDKMGPFAH